ncbi:MAG: phospho-sugar mutase [Myxococcales bacterium]
MGARLSFGTAGIRAPLGDGDDELNSRTVAVVGLAVCEYVGALDANSRSKGLCIGFDGRTGSREFAHVLAGVALAEGFVVRMFEDVVPTPLLAFTTQLHGAALGLMVTASHNPPADNGIKVYWQGGAQILPPHDAEIARRIGVSGGPSRAPMDLDAARASGQLYDLGGDEQRAYLDAVLALVPTRPEPLPKVGYSALCGVGTKLTRALAQRTGAMLIEVPSQATPRADFGGLRSPNPEHAEALVELVRLSSEIGAELGFCHDPDADRLAVVARGNEGKLRALSGDEIGALLADYLLDQEPEPGQVAIISTLVSGGLVERIATHFGAHFERTLTGFKWITAGGRRLERERGLRYLFGYEEALGYCFGALGDDKDGIAALYVLLQLARKLRAHGIGFEQQLERLARTHGLFASRQLTVSAGGASGMDRTRAILSDLRQRAPRDWLDAETTREDYLQREERADLLIFRVGARGRICVRPSGTEPKLKFYLEASESVSPDEPLAAAQARAEATLSWLASCVRGVTA